MTATRPIKLGRFLQDEVGILYGHISGLGIGSTNIISEPATSHEGKPYLKLIADPLGDSYEVGAAFPREKDGMKYYSVNLDSLLLMAPINAALFPDRDAHNTFNLVWNRPDQPKPSLDAMTQSEPFQGRRYVGANTAAATP